MICPLTDCTFPCLAVMVFLSSLDMVDVTPLILPCYIVCLFTSLIISFPGQPFNLRKSILLILLFLEEMELYSWSHCLYLHLEVFLVFFFWLQCFRSYIKVLGLIYVQGGIWGFVSSVPYQHTIFPASMAEKNFAHECLLLLSQSVCIYGYVG